MKLIRIFTVAACLSALAASALAESPIHMNNRLRIGYDDNVYQAGDATQADGSTVTHEETDSFRILEEIELLLNLNMPRTYLGLRYRPTLAWFSDREDDDTDLWHDLDLNFIQKFSPALSLSFNDTLRYSQLPELQDENFVVRQDDDNYYNSALATLSYNIQPETRIDVSGRHILLRYTEDDHENDNYYSVVGGLTLRQQLASRTTLMGDLRYQSLVYDEADAAFNRDANSLFAGLGAEQTFNPKMIGNVRAGVEQREYDNDEFDDNTQPYGELSVTFLPSPATRITGAASYSIYESDVSTYLSQNRTYFSLSFAHDFTAKLSVYASSAYAINEYEADYSLDVGAVDADETSILLSARLSYRINRINWIETGVQYVELDSDLVNRESYDRLRWDIIGWKIQLF
ncbi:MAG: outer membrane beta-barrel protein [Kiritimatiellia bacterium]